LEALNIKGFPATDDKMMKTQKTINLGDICESLEEGSNNGDNRPATADDLINDNTKKGNLDKLYEMTLDKKWIS